MRNTALENLKIRLDELEEQLSEFDENELAGIVSVLEAEIETQREFETNEGRFSFYGGLLIRIQNLKHEFDFFDKETELDNIYPDRHDPDFDEDSM